MRAVVQRVASSKVIVDESTIGEINKGLLILLGVTHEDTSKDVDYLLDKIVNLRIFEDENDKMNLSLKDVNGELLVVSQFTLYGDCRKGRRPNFTNAAKPDLATSLYEEFIDKAKKEGIKVGTGKFGAHMMVDLVNDGPVTILIDSEKTF
ncbi:D-tyrosyl-tRNA(Tyr) deacylase [[Clostridium] sordellii]|uniref:D-aminoacyl-tRNA deacylase n=1 Tax=Paraclostridium sordellii TaxID=1505 RepID=A0A9P1L1Z7_PARSO|nr:MULTISPECIES: D-aminoacyl-tRNA deacylase [Paeniclostridium]EPZ61046.1 D-tyrosyl-tRNA(Tyr) deacylase [[Clostridium] sordellii ATCC 9714] [Paeniclostridium sordellii ATCC 9714]MDU5019703.1 D-aminoacyl-tRNA deacylase [Clostridiales bacterium]AUN15537.1 D-tyrosyl-tRNA(Tyr) deacylase [Paeniclostridium sordellii]MBS6024045.1 D-tyrosyl-tRNA(Tyr) deacylase [Paeniclostridium sordellii]MBW4861768.1 D-tyrosyl-tRNA(Tyr) deacylase [Paeniclostridium sp.]